MTIKEARSLMMGMFPGRDVSATVTARHYADGAESVECDVFVHPGIIDIHGGDMFAAPTMPLAIAKAGAALREMDEDEPDYECEVE